jgi:ketosteroid isomerase-like protein
MKPATTLLLLLVLLTPGAAAADETISELAAQLRETERAFAATVRDKDLEAFASYLAEGAVFAAGETLRGREAILAGWAGLFAPEAPVLAWEPCVAEVEASGRIGFTRGPYWFEEPPGSSPEGAEVPQGTFFSVWERQAGGAWKIILDTGTPPEPGPPIVTPCAAAEAAR